MYGAVCCIACIAVWLYTLYTLYTLYIPTSEPGRGEVDVYVGYSEILYRKLYSDVMYTSPRWTVYETLWRL